MSYFQYNDGGRKAAGYKGHTRDCVARALAIALELPYQQVYDDLALLGQSERTGKRKRKRSHPRQGVYTRTLRQYLAGKGWIWVPTMQIGSGCQIHLDPRELPQGRLIVKVSKHVTCMLNGVIHDTFDCSRGGNRCVYGYWTKTPPKKGKPGEMTFHNLEKLLSF